MPENTDKSNVRRGNHLFAVAIIFSIAVVGILVIGGGLYLIFSQPAVLPNPSETPAMIITMPKTEPSVDNSEEIADFRNRLDFEYDDMEEITWIYAKGQRKGISDFTCYTYIGEKDGRYWIRFKFGFHRGDWIFMESIKIKSGGNTFNYSIPYGDRKTDVKNGIYEWFDASLTEAQIHSLRSVCASEEEATVRCYGDTYREDYVLTNSQKSNIITIIDYYDLVKE